jgi:hypothetical protein
MRVGLCPLLVALGAAVLGVAPARAQTGPVIVIPGKPGVPVSVNGVIVDGAVIYGDWGLARPGHGELIIEGPIAFTAHWDSRGYFPATGYRPRYGRLEVEPPRRPRANTNFYRDWAIESDSRRPVTEYPPFDPPPVVLAPRQRHR